MYEGGGSLKLAAAISAEAARLTTLEFSSKIYGSKRADFLNGAYGYVTSQARHLCELACALGGVMLKPYVADGKIETAFVPADSFEVTRVSGSGNIIGAKFYDSFFADGKKLYFDFVKVIFRLSAEVKVFIHNLPEGQISLQRNITVEDNITT